MALVDIREAVSTTAGRFNFFIAGEHAVRKRAWRIPTPLVGLI